MLTLFECSRVIQLGIGSGVLLTLLAALKAAITKY